MGKIDSAALLFSKINPKDFDERITFWHNSIYGLILFRQGDFSSAYEQLLKALSSNFTDTRALGLNERLLARISFSINDPDKGFEWLMLSTTHFKNADLIKSTGVNYKLLGRYYMNSQNHAEALINFKQAEKIFKKYNDQSELFYVNINLIDYYLHINDLNSARQYAKSCLEQSKNTSDNQMKTLIYNNMGEIELKAKNYQTAIYYFNLTLETPPDFITSELRMSNAHIKLAQIFRLLHKEEAALLHAQEARKILNEKKNFTTKYEIFKELSENYRLTNSAKLSFLFLDSARINIDSAYSTVMKSSKAFYETKVKLLTTSNHLEQFKTREKMQRYIFLTSIFALVFFIIFGIVVNRLLQSKNGVLKELVKKNLQIIEEEKKKNKIILLAETIRKENRKNTDSDKTDLLYNHLISWLETDNKYTRNDLTLELIAKEMNSNREYLSQAISNKNIRFNDLINKYRVEEAIHILSSPNDKRSRYSLSVIANEVGFNSNSVFIDAFKKQTGMKPAEFRQNLSQQNAL